MREAGFYLNTIYLVSVIASSVIVAEEAFFLNKKQNYQPKKSDENNV